MTGGVVPHLAGAVNSRVKLKREMLRRRVAAAVATTLAAAVSLRYARSDAPITSSVRYTREIARIMQRKCLPCHAPGGLSMSLDSYHDVRSWGRAIREEIVEARMPPWPAAPGYGHFANDLGLTARERGTLLMWIDGGMPRGDAADLPRPSPGAEADGDGPPGHRISVPPQTVPAGEELVVRRVAIPTDLSTPRWVERVVVRPGDRRVLRGALVFGEAAAAQGTAPWLGAWLPWQPSVAPPETHAFLLPARARLTLVLYYRGGDEAIVEQPAVELSFAEGDGRRAVDQLVLEARPRGGSARTGSRHSGELTLEQDATVWAIQPAPAESAASLELRARRPDGRVEVLLWMPRCLPEWPQALVLQPPALLPAGTIVSMVSYEEPSRAAASRVVLSVLR